MTLEPPPRLAHEFIAHLQAEATTNKGGGKAGLMDRLGGAAGHAKFICPLCKMQAPSLKNMEEHHEVECYLHRT